MSQGRFIATCDEGHAIACARCLDNARNTPLDAATPVDLSGVVKLTLDHQALAAMGMSVEMHWTNENNGNPTYRLSGTGQAVTVEWLVEQGYATPVTELDALLP